MERCTTIQRLRKPKVLNMSIFDWVTSLLGAYLVGRFLFGIQKAGTWALFVVGWILFGIITHSIFGVPTMLGYYLWLNAIPERKECVV